MQKTADIYMYKSIRLFHKVKGRFCDIHMPMMSMIHARTLCPLNSTITGTEITDLQL